MAKVKPILCSQCAKAPAVETQFRICAKEFAGVWVWSWTRCADHVEDGRKADRDHRRSYPLDRHFYLPIVQPVVDSEQAIAMEVALHAACRLLRICKGDDEAEQTLELLRQAQAEAWERVNGKEAA